MAFVPDEEIGTFVPDEEGAEAVPPLRTSPYAVTASSGASPPPPPVYMEAGAYDVNPSGPWESAHAGSAYGLRAIGPAAANLIPSAVGAARGMLAPLTPSGVEAISKIARGGLGISPEEKPAWEAFKAAFRERYGGLGPLERTMAQDPIGLALEAYGAKTMASGIGRQVVSSRPVRMPATDGRIPLTAGEALDSPMLQRMETLAEKVPLSGMTRFRRAQHEAADIAARNLLAGYIVDPAAPDVMAANRRYVSSMYQNVRDAISSLDDAERKVTPSATAEAANELLKRYPGVFKTLQDTEMEAVIRSIAGGVTRKKKGDGVTELKPVDVENMWMLRQALGDKIGQARRLRAAGQIDDTQYAQLRKLFSAASNDIDAWAWSIGDGSIADSLRAANDAYKTYVVKYDVLRRAYDKASKVVGDREMVSPARFATELKRIADKDQDLKRFTPDEIRSMTGLANIMQVVRRAGQFRENVPTGNRFLDFFMLKEAVTTAAVPISWAVTWLTTTPRGKALLARAASISPASPEMAEIVRTIYTSAPYFAGGAMPAVEEAQESR